MGFTTSVPNREFAKSIKGKHDLKSLKAN